MSLAWGGFRNGRVPQSALKKCVNYHPLPGEPVGASGGYLMAEAAHQFAVMDQHFFKETGQHLSLSEGYRDYTGQLTRWNIFHSGGNLAAYPGTSNHGWARSGDIGPVGRSWVKANGHKFGWYATVPSESWHFDYLGSPRITTAPAGSVPASISKTPLTPPTPKKRTKNMIHVRDKSTGIVYVVGPQQVRYVEDATAGLVATKTVGDRVDLDYPDLLRVFSLYGVPKRFAGKTGLKDLKASGKGFWSRGDDINSKIPTD